MRAGKVVTIVFGILAVLVSVALIVPGGFLVWAHGTQRDGDGFYATSTRTLSTGTYALTTPDVVLEAEPWRWLSDRDGATVRLQAGSTTKPLFLGIAPSDQVARYLQNVAHAEVTDGNGWFGAVDYRTIAGGAPLAAPGQQTFWVARQEGSGTLTVDWPLQSGEWTAVLMNADGTAQVGSSVSIGGRLHILLPIGLTLTGMGIVLLAIGILLIVLGARRSRPALPAAPGFAPGQPVVGQQAGA